MTSKTAIDILVSGPAGSGKSAVIQVITEALRDKGFAVSAPFVREEDHRSPDQLEVAISSIKEAARVLVFEGNTRANIEAVHRPSTSATTPERRKL